MAVASSAPQLRILPLPTSCRVNPKRDAKRKARSILSGSSSNVTIGGNGVRMIPARRSSTPLRLTSPTQVQFFSTAHNISMQDSTTVQEKQFEEQKQARYAKQAPHVSWGAERGVLLYIAMFPYKAGCMQQVRPSAPRTAGNQNIVLQFY